MALPARFWSLVGVTVLAHGAVLSALHTMGPNARAPVASGPPALVFQTRVLGAAASKAAVEPDPPVAAMSAREQPAPHEQPAPPAAAPAPVPVTMTPAAPTLPSESVAAAAPAASVAAVDDAPYLPRGQLTIAPALLGSVNVPFPGEIEGIVDLKVQITLFIDEEGRVRRIRLDAPQQVHPGFERAIRETWGEARFTPGRVHQVPVRSQLRLEVDFEAGARR